MEGSSRGEGDEVDKSGKNVKKTLPSASKLKRSAEKRKLSEDSNLTSVNIKVSILMKYVTLIMCKYWVVVILLAIVKFIVSVLL